MALEDAVFVKRQELNFEFFFKSYQAECDKYAKKIPN